MPEGRETYRYEPCVERAIEVCVVSGSGAKRLLRDSWRMRARLFGQGRL